MHPPELRIVCYHGVRSLRSQQVLRGRREDGLRSLEEVRASKREYDNGKSVKRYVCRTQRGCYPSSSEVNDILWGVEETTNFEIFIRLTWTLMFRR